MSTTSAASPTATSPTISPARSAAPSATYLVGQRRPSHHARPRLPDLVAAHPREGEAGLLASRPGRRRRRRAALARALLLGVSPGSRRRRDDHRQPQPGRGQRLQDHVRAAARSTAPSIQRLRARVEKRRGARRRARPARPSSHDILADYVDTSPATSSSDRGRSRSSSTAATAPAASSLLPILRRLGSRRRLYCELDGRFPNHHPDPTRRREPGRPDRARARDGAEVGIALDGDADRIGAVDGQGRILWGDQLVILFARDILAEQARRDVRRRGEVQPGAVRRDRGARRAAR